MLSLFSRYLPIIAWLGLIVLISSIPKPLEATPSAWSVFLSNTQIFGVSMVPIVSFIIHFFLFAVLGILTSRALIGGGRNTPGLLFLGLMLCILFGVLDELYQEFIPGRGFEWIDLFANALGAGTGLFAFGKL